MGIWILIVVLGSIIYRRRYRLQGLIEELDHIKIVDSISVIKGSRIQGKVPCFRCITDDRYTFRYYDDEGNWTGNVEI